MSIALQIKKKVVNSNYAYFRSRKINFKYDLKNEIIERLNVFLSMLSLLAPTLMGKF